jgi:hypothetical protein
MASAIVEYQPLFVDSERRGELAYAALGLAPRNTLDERRDHRELNGALSPVMHHPLDSARAI